MSTFIPPAPLLDDSGDLVAGGKINFYDTGTTNAKNTYSDQALTSANPNPVVLDSSGRPTSLIFLETDAAYTVQFTDSSDTQIWSYDNVVAAMAAQGPIISDAAAISNYGVIAEADASSPTYAALRLVPQDANPSSPAEGDFVSRDDMGGQLLQYNGDLSYWVPVGSMLIAKTTATAAQMKALNASPVTLVTAPAAGSYHVYHRAILVRQAGSVAYAASSDIVIENSDGIDLTAAIASAAFNTGTNQRVFYFPRLTSTTADDIADTAPSASSLQLTATTDPTTGDMSCDIYVWYTTISLT